MTDASMMFYLPQVEKVAVEERLAELQRRYPALGVCALLPEAEKERVAVVQDACAVRNVPLVGAIFPALVRNGQFLTDGVWLMCFEKMPYCALHGDLPTESGDAEREAERIAGEIRDHIGGSHDLTLFMLFDAMAPKIGTVLDTLYLHLANRVHYAGANAGSESFQPMPCLFDGDRIVQNGMLLMLLTSHKGAIVEHGYHAAEHSSYATSTSGNRISQIDWQPAFRVYQNLVREQCGEEVTADNFYRYGVHFPFGIVRANHHVVVRIPVMLAEDGSLFCVGEVPANSVLTLLKSPTVHTAETLHKLTQGLSVLNQGTTDAELLLFYCAGRRMHLGKEMATTELEALAGLAEASQIGGALSLGEIGSSTVHGYPLFHNAALVAARW